MAVRGHATPSQDGVSASFFGIAMDVTERRRSEEAARLIDARFQMLADGIPQLAWMARADGSIYWFNRRWHEYTGTLPEDMEGWGWQTVHDPAVLPTRTIRLLARSVGTVVRAGSTVGSAVGSCAIAPNANRLATMTVISAIPLIRFVMFVSSHSSVIDDAKKAFSCLPSDLAKLHYEYRRPRN